MAPIGPLGGVLMAGFWLPLAAGGVVWDPVTETYVDGRIFVGPNDPTAEGYTGTAGDFWLNPDVFDCPPELIDDDTFASASPTSVPSSESVKAYVDAEVSGVADGIPDAVQTAGRWEVVVSGVPAEAVTNEAEDDWLYTWVGA